MLAARLHQQSCVRTTAERNRPGTRNRLLGIGIVALLLGVTWHRATASPRTGAVIEIWVRGKNQLGDRGAAHERSRGVNLDRLRLVTVDRFDVQYDRKGQYRGIPLRKLLNRFRSETSVDLAILHFVNGMAIPVPFRDSVAMSRLDPFIATALRAGAQAPPAPGRFPDVVKKDSPVDRRPIRFSGNKIVVADGWHPEVSSTAQPGFSPWVHADTLVGVELVAAEAYYAQFDVGGDASVRAGLALFRQSCQFCHGAREVGATFGWDFVDSAPMSGYQDSAANLYHNIAFKPTNAAEIGLMMPRLGFLSEEAAGDIRHWVQALGTTPIPPYQRP